MIIPSHYKGREQSFIKHELLKSYIERLFMIIGQREKRICFIDCFAGPWQEGSNDLSNTSIAISLNIMQKCCAGLKKLGRNVQFRALYIEKEKIPFNKLRSYLENEIGNDVDADAFQGEFYDLREDILKWCGKEDFAFFFIDPKGWKKSIEIPTLRPLLKRSNSEYLINFMFDFLLRAHSQSSYEDQMKQIFGKVPDTAGMIPKQKETYLLKLYIENLKSIQPVTREKPRSAYVKVLDPLKDRTKYDLVYLTRHPMGIVVFMEESEKLDFIQKVVREQTKQDRRINKTGQLEFNFAQTDIKKDGDKVELQEVKNYWMNKLSYTQVQFGIEEFADMLEETRWYIIDFQKAFNDLLSEGKVKNLSSTRKRPVHAIHFKDNYGKGEFLIKVKK